MPREEIRPLERCSGSHAATGLPIGAGTGLPAALVMWAVVEHEANPLVGVDHRRAIVMTAVLTGGGAIIG